jgi:lipoate-protein ligase A
MTRDLWHVLDSGLGSSAWNMALDEALLEAMPRLGRPVFRFYGWTEPAASFGYFQKYRDVESLTTLRPLVRRPTGGGLVPHDHDWTYSLAVPTMHEWYAQAAKESYRRVHRWLQWAFEQLGLKTMLAPTASKAQPGQCFVGYEQSDLLWENRKIAGAAQRRRRDGLLIQGSVQPPPDAPARSAWEQQMGAAGEEHFRIGWTEWTPDAALLERAEALAAQKYSRADYNLRR